MLWLRLKGCHVVCNDGRVEKFQHMWVTGSVMWAAASDESLKFGVQGATMTDFHELTVHEIMGFDCIFLIKELFLATLLK